MSIHERLAEAREAFKRAGIPPEEAAIDAELLARHVLGLDRAAFIARLRDPAPPQFADRYLPLVSRRVSREPMAYILGHREFWGLDFAVTPDVLVPRPETEFVIEQALSLVPDRATVRRILDIGTGTGCLAVSLGCEFPGASVVATDISVAALAVARRNADRLGVGDRFAVVQADMLDGVDGIFDLIVSNPPYVPEPERENLQVEVARFEPTIALFGGLTGLSMLGRLFRDAPAHLASGGLLVVEFGYGQEQDVLDVSAASGWHVVSVAHDYQDIPRAAAFRR